MANSVCWYGHLFWREDDVLRRALDSEVEGQRKNWRPKMTWKNQVGRKCEGCFAKGRRTLLFKVECRHKHDCCWVEVNLATPTYCGYYQILYISFSVVGSCKFF